MWVYALVITIIALFIMICWSYFVARNLFRPSVQRAQIRSERIQQQQGRADNSSFSLSSDSPQSFVVTDNPIIRGSKKGAAT